MSLRKIETGANNPFLRQKAKIVNQITVEIKQLIFDMTETIEIKETNVGLAANQLGQLLRIIVVKPEADKKTLTLINPQIKKISRKKTVMEEGCLSLPNTIVPVERPDKITVQALDINGQLIKIKAKGFSARVIQHEIDHLDGILIIDKKYAQA